MRKQSESIFLIHSCPACAVLCFLPLHLSLFFSYPKSSWCPCHTHTSCGTNGEGRQKQEGERFHVLGYCCPLTTSQIFYLFGRGFCLIAEENKALMITLPASLPPPPPPLLHSPWKKGHGLPLEGNQGKYQIKMVIVRGLRDIICKAK